MINVIWSDDQFNDLAHKSSTQESALAAKIKVTAFATWEEVKSELTHNGNNYDLIILDGKGQRQIDSPTSDSKHLGEAMTWLSSYNYPKLKLPIIVYTGFLENISENWEGNPNIFKIIEKTNWPKLISEINIAVANSDKIAIRQEHEEAWKIFTNGFLNESTEGKLLSLVLKKMHLSNFNKSDFNTIREILESLLLKFNEIDNSDNFLPNDVLTEKGGINLEWSLRILKGLRTETKYNGRSSRIIEKNFKPVIEKGNHIAYSLDYVKETSSALSHNVKYNIANVTFQSTIYALLDVLKWANEVLEKKCE